VQEAAGAQVGQQARQPRRARRPEAPLRLVDDVGEHVPAVEELEELGVVVAQAQERAGLQVLQHPPLGSFAGLQAFQRVARPHARTAAGLEPGDARTGPGRRRHGERRPDPDDLGPPRLGGVPPALHR
jgi:hypothetical protein